jgi:hypothetical protein
MRVLVTGGRDYTDRDHIWNTLCDLDIERGPITHVIHGCATGADSEAMIWAQTPRTDGRQILHCPFRAEWGAGLQTRTRDQCAETAPVYLVGQEFYANHPAAYHYLGLPQLNGFQKAER